MYSAREWEWNAFPFGWAELCCGWRWCNQWMFEFRMNVNAQFLHSCMRFLEYLFAFLLLIFFIEKRCWWWPVLRTSKFLRITKCCGVSGKNMNSKKNTIGSGKKICGTRLYGKCVPAMNPSRIPMQTLSINNEPSRPRILWKWTKKIENKLFRIIIFFKRAICISSLSSSQSPSSLRRR